MLELLWIERFGRELVEVFDQSRGLDYRIPALIFDASGSDQAAYKLKQAIDPHVVGWVEERRQRVDVSLKRLSPWNGIVSCHLASSVPGDHSPFQLPRPSPLRVPARRTRSHSSLASRIPLHCRPWG